MRRIQRSQDKEELVKQLTTGENAAFTEIWRLMLFSAMLGYKLGRREPLGQKDSGKAVMESYFANSPVWPGVLYLLGLVQTQSTEVMIATEDAENQLLTIFEEYANGGLAYLNEQFRGRTPTLLSILDIVNGVLASSGVRSPNLAEIAI
jgi:dnd system-associated protein 4